MLVRSRLLLLVPLALATLLLAGGPLPASGTTSASGPSPARAGSPPGKVGPALELTDQAQIYGYDVAVDLAGTTYIGWIGAQQGAPRVVHLCVLTPGATECVGGVRSVSSLGDSSAAGLHVVMTDDGPVLVWFHDTPQSIDGPFNAKLAAAEVADDFSVGPPTDVAAAPSFGQLFDVVLRSGNDIYAVTGRTVTPPGEDPVTELQVHQGLGDPWETLTAPTLVGKARIGFSATGWDVLVVDEYGAIGKPLRVSSHLPGESWSSFARIPGTWSVGGAFDVGTSQGAVRLVAPVDNASYYPRIATWKGPSFGPFSFTGDKGACAPTSHDLFQDWSGRLVDTSVECRKVRLLNHHLLGKDAALTKFGISNTPAGGEAQIGTTPRGTGWVVWGQQSEVGGAGNRLLAARVRLPVLSTSRSNQEPPGSVRVTGPVFCLPPVDTSVGVSVNPARGWSVVSKQLLLDGDPQGGTLRGATFAPATGHTLTGVATFARDGDRRTVRAELTFKSCADPSAF